MEQLKFFAIYKLPFWNHTHHIAPTFPSIQSGAVKFFPYLYACILDHTHATHSPTKKMEIRHVEDDIIQLYNASVNGV